MNSKSDSGDDSDNLKLIDDEENQAPGIRKKIFF